MTLKSKTPLRKVKRNKVCNFCENKNSKRRRVQYIYKHNNNFLIVNDVPCEECEYCVCKGCGTRYYSASVLTNIHNIVRGRKKAEKQIPMAVYSL